MLDKRHIWWSADPLLVFLADWICKASILALLMDSFVYPVNLRFVYIMKVHPTVLRTSGNSFQA